MGRVEEDSFQSEDVGVRRRALKAAAVARDGISEKQLTALMGDPDAEVARQAREELDRRVKKRTSWLPHVSLLELLIVVVIIAACIQVIVPYQVSGWVPAPRARAREQLDNIRKAILLYETSHGKCRENDLHFLSPRFLTEVPIDPWGYPYHLDSRTRQICTLGADGRTGGQDYQADIVEPLFEMSGNAKEAALVKSQDAGRKTTTEGRVNKAERARAAQ